VAYTDGEALVAPLRAFGTPLVDFSHIMPYRTIQSLYDAIFPKGRDRCYWKSLYLQKLDNNVIDDLVAHLADRPPDMKRFRLGARQRSAARASDRDCLW
jgi:hypothetical protein